jgi:hypothetical protein
MCTVRPGLRSTHTEGDHLAMTSYWIALNPKGCNALLSTSANCFPRDTLCASTPLASASVDSISVLWFKLGAPAILTVAVNVRDADKYINWASRVAPSGCVCVCIMASLCGISNAYTKNFNPIFSLPLSAPALPCCWNGPEASTNI